MPQWVKRNDNIIMYVVVLFAFFVGLYHLGDARISHDELKTLRLINEHDSREVLTNFYSFSHVFLSFLLDIIHELSQKFYFLRLVPVGFGVLAVAMTYRAGRSLLGSRVALMAAYFLVITPIFTQYHREMRGYSAMVFFGLVMLFSLWRAIATGQKRYWLGLGIAAVLGVYTHLYFTLALMTTSLIIAGDVLTIWLADRPNLRRVWSLLWPATLSLAAVGFILAMLYLPIAGQILAVPDEQTLRPPVFGQVEPTGSFFLRFVGIFQYFNPLGTFRGFDYFLILVGLGGVWGGWQPATRRATSWLLAWWLAPFLGNILVMALAPGSSAQMRFHLQTLPAYLLLGSFGIFALGGLLARWSRSVVPLSQVARLRRLPVVGLLALLLLLITIPNLIQSLNEKTDEAWTSVSAYLRAEARPGDVVICEAFALHGGRGGDDGSCSWQLSDVAHQIEPPLPNQSLSRVANFRGAEPRLDTFQQKGRVWFVMNFPGPPPYNQAELAERSELTVRQFRSTWVVRVDTGETLHENLIATGEWLLANVPDEKHRFGYHLDLAQLYALAGQLKAANVHLQAAVETQQASSDPDWGPEFAQLREVAAIIQFYAPVPPSPEHLIEVNFDDRLTLTGYSLEPDRLSRPAEIKLSFYWQMIDALKNDYVVLVHLQDRAGNTVGHFDFQPYDAILPTSQWPVGAKLREARQFSLPDDLPSGQYTFVIGLYRPDTMQRLRVVGDVSGQNIVKLGTIFVEALPAESS